jgi:hypothetical protein
MDRVLMMLLAGFLDALNPCALTATGIFGLLLFLLRDSRFLIRAFISQMLFFYFGTGFFVLAGWEFDYFYSLSFQAMAVLYHLIFGIIFIGSGIWMFWVCLRISRGHWQSKISSLVVREPTFLRFLGVVLGVLLAVPVVLWSPHWWVTAVANEMFLPGKALGSYAGMAWYGIVKLWPMFLMTWMYRSVRRNGLCAVWVNKYPSRFFAVAAAFYTGVGLGLVLYFFQKL